MKQFINRMLSTRWISELLLISMLIFSPIFLQAREFEEHEVRTAVETWVRSVPTENRPDAIIERMEPHVVKGETVAYIAYLQDGGFCLCGANELVLPVYLYSPNGKYDPQNPNYQFILWEIEARTKNMIEGVRENDPGLQQYQSALAKRSVFWQNLIAGIGPQRKEKVEGILAEPDLILLNVTSHWHQDAPYNDQCPVLTPPDEHTVVGCVATAMAQIMYYWKWPNTGVDDNDVDYNYRYRNNWDSEPLTVDPQIPSDWDNRLRWPTPTGGNFLQMNGYWDKNLYEKADTISSDSDYLDALDNLWNRLNQETDNYYANFGATTYDWSMINDVHPHPSGDAEVAELCYHVGVALGMNYGVKGSSAPGENIANALEDNFRYDLDAYYSARDKQKMIEEIQWLRPVALCGDRSTTTEAESKGKVGHCWVVHGYDKSNGEDPLFWVNMGWGGAWDDWYICDEMGGSLDPYNIDQEHNTQIAPLNVVKFVGSNDPGDGSPDDPYEDIEEAIVEAPTGATLIFKAGSVNTLSASSLVINRALTLKGKDVIIRKE